jgi:predicted O-methyltransferase YrrM
MADLDRIERLIDGAPYMRRPNATQLAELFGRLKPKQIVEIGTYHGAGTCYMAELASDYGGHVTTIDLPWTAERAEHMPKVEQLVDRCGLDNVCIVRRPDGAEGWFGEHFDARLRLAESPLDFVYLDGGHTWPQVIAQFAMAYAALRPGGWIVFDDVANTAYPDVAKAWRMVIAPTVHKFRQAGNWGFVMKG